MVVCPKLSAYGLAWDFGQVLTEIDGYFVSLQRKLDDFGQDLTESLPITALFMINKNMNREQIIEIIRCGENSHVQFKEHFTTQKQMAEELAAIPADKREIVPLCRTNRYIIVALYVWGLPFHAPVLLQSTR